MDFYNRIDDVHLIVDENTFQYGPTPMGVWVPLENLAKVDKNFNLEIHFSNNRLYEWNWLNNNVNENADTSSSIDEEALLQTK